MTFNYTWIIHLISSASYYYWKGNILFNDL